MAACTSADPKSTTPGQGQDTRPKGSFPEGGVGSARGSTHLSCENFLPMRVLNIAEKNSVAKAITESMAGPNAHKVSSVLSPTSLPYFISSFAHLTFLSTHPHRERVRVSSIRSLNSTLRCHLGEVACTTGQMVSRSEW